MTQVILSISAVGLIVLAGIVAHHFVMLTRTLKAENEILKRITRRGV